MLYDTVTEGYRELTHDRILRGVDAEGSQMARAATALIGSQNSPKAVLLCWHKLKGEGSRGLGGGRRENSGKAMKDEPCSWVRHQGGLQRYTTGEMDTP